VSDREPLGVRLRAARVRNGLSQGQLQVRSGVPKSRLSRYENGHLIPSLQTLRRLAEALDVSQATLLDDREESVEAFCKTLSTRGVSFGTVDEARALGETVADMLNRRGDLPQSVAG
jgi:transcriptional regulator with XRE-family HTH domain